MFNKTATALFAFLLSLNIFCQTIEQIPYDFAASLGENANDEGDDRAMGFWVLPFTGAGSPWTRIPGNTNRFQRNHYLVRATEIAQSGFPTGSTIDGIGFQIGEAGVGTQTGNLKIYLMNTSDVTNTLGNTWDVSNFTLVCDIPSWTVPIELGSYTIDFSGGTSFTYAGEGVYVAFEFSNPSGPIGTTALSARCNDLLSGGVHSSQSNASLPTTLPSSGFRPQTQFVNNELVDIARIDKIYTLEKVVADFMHVPIQVRVTNVSNASATFDVIVTVSNAANTTIYHTASSTVNALAAGASTLVNIEGWFPEELGNVILTAETSVISGENWLSNNSLSIPVNVNQNTVSYTFDNADPTPTTFGYNHPNTGLFLAKYAFNGLGAITGVNVVIPNFAANVGNTVYAVVLKSGGAIVAQSENYTIQASDLGTTKNFSFSNPPLFYADDNYVGIAQTAGTATWRPLGVFAENPRRANVFYTSGINGGTLTELEAPFNFKFGIEAVLDVHLSIDSYPNQHPEISVYPNPTNGLVNIELKVFASGATDWKVVDVNDRVVLFGSMDLISGQNTMALDLSSVAHGLYFFKTNSGTFARIVKMID